MLVLTNFVISAQKLCLNAIQYIYQFYTTKASHRKTKVKMFGLSFLFSTLKFAIYLDNFPKKNRNLTPLALNRIAGYMFSIDTQILNRRVLTYNVRAHASMYAYQLSLNLALYLPNARICIHSTVNQMLMLNYQYVILRNDIYFILVPFNKAAISFVLRSHCQQHRPLINHIIKFGCFVVKQVRNISNTNLNSISIALFKAILQFMATPG